MSAAAQAAAVQASQPQDLGLARLGALGALADLADGAVGGGDLLNEVPSTINYEDLVIGNQAAAHGGKKIDPIQLLNKLAILVLCLGIFKLNY